MDGDKATHFLGWNFFRNSPWGLPIGLNWSYGMGIGGSIVYSDSIPLFAFIFKAFRGVLPAVFQYSGIWIMFCLTLQGGFAWMLMSKITQSITMQLCGTLFFIVSPTMTNKLRAQFALGAHWTILAALVLYFTKNKAVSIYWAALLILTSLVHGYLLIMNGIIWGADCLKRLVTREKAFANTFFHFLITVSLVTLCMWISGYFTIEKGISTSGVYGTYRLNVLALINPEHRSYILPTIPSNKGDSAGFCFLGSGMLILAVAGLSVFTKSSGFIKTNYRVLLPLFFASVILTAFAISNRVGIADTELFAIKLPESTVQLLSTFKASGRLFWPVYYILMLSILYLVISYCPTKASRKLVILAIILQVLDLKPIMSKSLVVGVSNEDYYQSPLKSVFWAQSAKKYKNIRFVLPENLAANWDHFAYYASFHRMAINTGYFARVSHTKLEKEQATVRRAVITGNYDKDTLYIFNDSALWHEAQIRNNKYDYVNTVDGFHVIAPGWKELPQKVPQV